jgi:hypothetical protein
MKELVEGHRYVAANFENPDNGQTIQFIQKEPKQGGIPGELVTINDGTTNEEILEILLHRLNYLNKKFPCRENALAITHIETGLLWLYRRTELRKKANVEGKQLSH